MKKNIILTLIIFSSFIISGCTTHDCSEYSGTTKNEPYYPQSEEPIAPTEEVLSNIDLDAGNTNTLPLLSSGIVGGMAANNSISTTSSPKHSSNPTDPANFITLMGQNGRVLTVWALAQRNWLWAYSNKESGGFGTIRNWRLQKSLTPEHFKFVNQSLGTCMEAYRNGVIHNQCNSEDTSQDFELLPTNTGAVVVRSLSQNRCLTYNPVSSTGYSTVTLEQCTGVTSALKDQTWYLAPPLLNAHTLN